MSPEQAAGRPADFRSDIFSFGCVVYEMLTGKRAFQEATAVDTLAAILHAEPSPLDATFPEQVRWIVDRCLAKDPSERYAATRDLARDLQLVARSSTTGPTVRASGIAPPRERRAAIALALVAAALALGAVCYVAGRLVTRPQPDYRNLTQRRGVVLSGRVAGDGRTVVYGAAWDGQPPEVFATTDRHRGESRALGLGDADLFSISPSGELAVALHRRYFQGRETTGTLATVPLAGGAAREVLEDVRDAEYLPNGELLVVREEDGRVRLRRLGGEVLFETAVGWLSHVRASPDGRKLAFLVHPVRRDNRGKLVILDIATKAILSESSEWPIVEGVAWHPGGKEVWYSPIWRILAMSIGGKDRVVARFPAQVRLLDLDSEGRVLLAQELASWGIRGLLRDQPREKELSWLDQSYVGDVSSDGRSLLFTEYGFGDQYGVFFRKTATSPAIPLGEGAAMSLSPDGGSALAIRFGPPPQVVILPTGAGSTRALPRGAIDAYVNAAFFPDGARVLLWASEKGKGLRYYVQDLAGGDPRPVTPEGVTVQADANPITPDGTLVAASVKGGPLALYPVDGGGEPRRAAGVESGEQALRFHPDGRLFVGRNISRAPVRIALVDLATGKRTPVYELQPDDLAGVADVFNVVLSPDGRAYAYSYLRTLSTVYLAGGLR